MTTVPFPGHPEPHTMTWSALEKAAIQRYAEDCVHAATEAQAREIEALRQLNADACAQIAKMDGNNVWWPTTFNKGVALPHAIDAAQPAKGQEGSAP